MTSTREDGDEDQPRHRADAERRTNPSAVPLDADEQPDFAEEYDHASGRVDEAEDSERSAW